MNLQKIGNLGLNPSQMTGSIRPFSPLIDTHSL